MTAPVFIGDEVTASGFRLAGVRVRTPLPEDVASVVSWAQRNSLFIMITAEYIELLEPDQRQQLLSQQQPPVAVVPDIRAKIPIHDLATHLRSQLGVLE